MKAAKAALVRSKMKLKDLIEPNELDKKGEPVKLLNVYDPKNRSIGRRTGIAPRTVVVKSSDTGQVSGRRSAYLKTGKGAEAPLPKDDPEYS